MLRKHKRQEITMTYSGSCMRRNVFFLVLVKMMASYRQDKYRCITDKSRRMCNARTVPCPAVPPDRIWHACRICVLNEGTGDILAMQQHTT